MSALVLLLVLAGAPRDAPKAGVPAVPDVLGAMKAFTTKKGHGAVTACASCHATSSWTDVRFDHERTGFSLTGKHQKAPCQSCHGNDFSTPLARGCAACHRDVHAGELGQRCESCHDTADWRSRFDVDAHRRTNFPLVGAHAALPCVECHAEARERRFSRAAVECQGCHQADAVRTVAPVNHLALGLEQRNCRECHTPVAYTPARFPTHDECFPISAGAHAGVPCLNCHFMQIGGGTAKCATGTARCTQACHERVSTDEEHAEGKAPGYVYSDRRCLDCHFPRTGRLP